MSDLGDAAIKTAAGGGGFAGIWFGIRWTINFIVGRVDKREAKLNAREEKLDAEEEARVDELKTRLTLIEATVKAQGAELGAHRIAIHILVAKVARDDPSAPELKQVADILGASFPIHVTLPTDMAEQLSRLD